MRLFNKMGQSTLEYATITIVGAMVIIIAGPMVIRSVNAMFKTMGDAQQQSINDPLYDSTPTPYLPPKECEWGTPQIAACDENICNGVPMNCGEGRHIQITRAKNHDPSCIVCECVTTDKCCSNRPGSCGDCDPEDERMYYDSCTYWEGNKAYAVEGDSECKKDTGCIYDCIGKEPMPEGYVFCEGDDLELPERMDISLVENCSDGNNTQDEYCEYTCARGYHMVFSDTEGLQPLECIIDPPCPPNIESPFKWLTTELVTDEDITYDVETNPVPIWAYFKHHRNNDQRRWNPDLLPRWAWPTKDMPSYAHSILKVRTDNGLRHSYHRLNAYGENTSVLQGKAEHNAFFINHAAEWRGPHYYYWDSTYPWQHPLETQSRGLFNREEIRQNFLYENEIRPEPGRYVLENIKIEKKENDTSSNDEERNELCDPGYSTCESDCDTSCTQLVDTCKQDYCNSEEQRCLDNAEKAWNECEEECEDDCEDMSTKKREKECISACQETNCISEETYSETCTDEKETCKTTCETNNLGCEDSCELACPSCEFEQLKDPVSVTWRGTKSNYLPQDTAISVSQRIQIVKDTDEVLIVQIFHPDVDNSFLIEKEHTPDASDDNPEPKTYYSSRRVAFDIRDKDKNEIVFRFGIKPVINETCETDPEPEASCPTKDIRFRSDRRITSENFNFLKKTADGADIGRFLHIVFTKVEEECAPVVQSFWRHCDIGGKWKWRQLNCPEGYVQVLPGPGVETTQEFIDANGLTNWTARDARSYDDDPNNPNDGPNKWHDYADLCPAGTSSNYHGHSKFKGCFEKNNMSSTGWRKDDEYCWAMCALPEHTETFKINGRNYKKYTGPAIDN